MILRELIIYKIEELYKHNVDRKIHKILKKTGLVPETPHDMNMIMKNAESIFVDLELNSEITVSSGVSATAMQNGFSGIVNISPFAWFDWESY